MLTTEQLRNELDQSITANEAATVLGTTADQIRKLMTAGILSSERRHGRMLLCPRAEVDGLCATIEVLAVGHAEGYQTAAAYLPRGVSVAELIRRLEDGKVRARRLDGRNGISSLVVVSRKWWKFEGGVISG